MYFAQQIYDEDYTELVQYIISLHFKHDYEKISNLLKIKYNSNEQNEQHLDENRYRLDNLPVNKYFKGMIFIKDENPVTNKVVKMDKETNYLLNTLLLTTSNIIKESCIINLIIENWVKGNFVKDKIEVMNVFTVGNYSRFSIEVGQTSWDSFLKICKNNRIAIQNGFKMAIKYYFNDLYNNINEINH